MTPFTRIEGRAYPLPFSNIDTDLIIPAAHLKTIRRSGLGQSMRGEVTDLPVAEVNGRIFLNFSALGFHPELVRHRDAQRKTLGRKK